MYFRPARIGMSFGPFKGREKRGCAMVYAKRASLVLGVFCLALVVAASDAQAQDGTGAAIAPVQKCGDLVNFHIPGTNMTITKAEAIPTTPPGTLHAASITGAVIPVAIPPYCRAEGVIDQRTGFDNKPYAIGFAIALPDNWNGRFLFQGGGGLNGSITPPLGGQAAGDSPALARGFAVVSTDTGHKGAVFDAAFMKDQLADLNFAYIAVGRVAVISKEIITQYYGQAAKHSYYDGCSTGGREGMLMSQRYPTYFDGVVVGDPAMRTGYSNIGLTYARNAFAQIASKDASGKPEPAKDFSPADKKLLADAIMKSCDEKDGLKDGMIFNTEACQFDPAVLKCKGAKTDSCLRSASRRFTKGIQRTEGFARERSLCSLPMGHGLHPQRRQRAVRRILQLPADGRTEHDRTRAARGKSDHRSNGRRGGGKRKSDADGHDVDEPLDVFRARWEADFLSRH